MDDIAKHGSSAPLAVRSVFGTGSGLAAQYVSALERHGVERGLIGPREVDRIWERHMLNSAVIGECIPHGSSVVDVGSGAGLPGVPLGIARPDLDMVLLEPMARRVDWLEEVVRELGLSMTVLRGRAEEGTVREKVHGADVVTARALAPLARLSTWCLPLVRPGGVVLAVKGASIHDELARDRDAVYSAGATEVKVVTCGSEVVQSPTTAVLMTRATHTARQGRRVHRSRRSRK